MRYIYKIVAPFLCLLFGILAFFSVSGFDWENLKYSGDAITADELSHIPAGYYYLTTGRYFLNNEHPPLVKDLAAIPFLFLKPATAKISGDNFMQFNWVEPKYPYPENVEFPKELEIFNRQWDWGRLLLFHSQNNPDILLFWARLSVVFFNSLALFILYLSLKKLWGIRASLLSLFFIAISQFSLAHASLVTLDFMPTIFEMTGFVWFSMFLTKFAKKEAHLTCFSLSALFFTLAMLSKFSFALTLPIAFISGLIYLCLKSRKQIFPYLLRFITLSLFIMILIGLFMSFHVRNMDEDAMLMQASLDYPPQANQIVLNIIYSLINTGNAFLKGLAEYMIGVVMVLVRLEGAAQSTYFMGKVYGLGEGNYLYFPILYFTKLSLGFLFLLIVASGLVIYRFFKSKIRLLKRFKNFIFNPLSLILPISIYVYLVVTFSSNFQIGLRHIMPVVIASFILVAKGLDNYWDYGLTKALKLKHVFVVVFLAMVFSTIWSFPYYLEYYNYLGGGVENGYKIATDSNYDWGGQDIKRLAKWQKDNNISDLYTHIFTNVPPEYYFGMEHKHFDIGWSLLPPSGSYIAVSIFEYMNNIYSDNPEKQKYTILKDGFVTKVGKTMLIFKIP